MDEEELKCQQCNSEIEISYDYFGCCGDLACCSPTEIYECKKCGETHFDGEPKHKEKSQ